MTQALLDDDTFLSQFENLTLDPVHFSHLGHLRLAWLYLDSNDIDTASEQACHGIQRYAASLGAHDKFHMTITDSLVRIIGHRINANKIQTWESFQETNTDIITDALSVLNQYYSNERLFSDEAKVSLVSPDKQPIS